MTSWTSSTDLRRYLYPTIIVLLTAGVGIAGAAMGGGSSVPFLAMATAVLGFVVWGVFRAAQALVREPAAREATVATGRRRKELEREKQALVKALKELEFDHKMGKVSDKDFADISGTYRARAVRVMRQLDEAGRDYETLIAEEVKKRRSGPSAVSPPPSAQKTTEEDDPTQCRKCSTKNDADAEFCKKCGTKLASAEAAS
jgi:hypothetical protein